MEVSEIDLVGPPSNVLKGNSQVEANIVMKRVCLSAVGVVVGLDQVMMGKPWVRGLEAVAIEVWAPISLMDKRVFES